MDQLGLLARLPRDDRGVHPPPPGLRKLDRLADERPKSSARSTPWRLQRAAPGAGSRPRSRRRRPAQAAGWPKIASGANTLICAPTGSGKTLSAFLWGIDTLARASPRSSATGVADRLRLAAEGALLRHRAQPAGAAEGDRRRGLGRPAHRRHAAARAPGDAAHAARHPDHDPRVALPDDHLAGARDPHRGRGGDRRRDPRRRPVQARRPPRADPRAALAPGHAPRAAPSRSGSGSRRPSGRSSGSRSSSSARSASARSSTPASARSSTSRSSSRSRT